jgi:hypothetical protein
LVADSTASSLESWIGFAVDLHMALHSSSPVSNQKDVPTWLLEWIDAGVVYQRNGARGFLRYSAILDEVGGGREQWPRTWCGAVWPASYLGSAINMIRSTVYNTV